ncbi:MAG: hypothetical protein KME16_09570 [Scytolyngbya sp. HA4215-MV1]|jgi:hypothetical protein|nr:hypothetical protein [Scytolyngbya sp. HA4215-MV1]
MWYRPLLFVVLLVTSLNNAVRVLAAPDPVFTPHLNQIQRSLPPKWVMRLPDKILLGGPADEDFINQLNIKLFSSTSPPGLTIGLFSCDSGPHPCLVGSFSVEAPTSDNTQREWKQHLAAATPIELTQGVQGYLLEGNFRQPPSIFSSVMWQQDGLLYTVSFLLQERQNILYMAHSMANSQPIRSTLTPHHPSASWLNLN